MANPYDVYVTTVHQRLVHAPEIQRSEAAAEVAQTCSNTGRDMAALIQDRTSSGADPAQALAFVDDRAAFVMAYCPSERQPLDAASMALFDYTSPI